jgi:hypothetical protein
MADPKPFRSGMPPGVGNVIFGIVLLLAGIGVTVYSANVVWWGAMLVGAFEIVYGLYRIIRRR